MTLKRDMTWRIALGLLAMMAMPQSARPAEVRSVEPAEIIFAVRQPGAGGHWYENFGHYAFDEDRKAYGAEGRLCRLDLNSGQLSVLLEDAEGAVRDPQLHYDGKKILFSYRRGGSDYFHLFEIGVMAGDSCN